MQNCLKYLLILTAVVFFSTVGNNHAVAQSLQPITRGINIQAVVPPSANDFQFSLKALDSQTVRQNQVLTYEITYGASNSAGQRTQNTIVARYSSDRDPNNAYLADYIISSATPAYGGVQPVIDQQNRTITWTIPSLPQGVMNQKVTFQLRTKSIYTLPEKLTLSNNAVMQNTFFSFPEQYTRQEYLYEKEIPGPQPTASVTPMEPSPTGSIQKKTTPLEILLISQFGLTPTEAVIDITTNQPSRTTIYYGRTPEALTTITEDPTVTYYHTMTLKNLLPAMPYYYKISATDTQGNVRWSDTLTFTTPKQTTANPIPIKGTLTLLNQNSLIHSAVISDDYTGVVLPKYTDYQVIYTPESGKYIAALDLLITSQNGIQQVVRMTSNNQSSYTATIQTGDAGRYTLVLLQKDSSGTIQSKKLSEMIITEPFLVRDSKTGKPIEDASITLSRYDVIRKIFVPFNSGQTASNYTILYTDKYGQAFITLPPGEYQAEIRALGYAPATITFAINGRNGNGFPIVQLDTSMLDTSYIFQTIKIIWKNGIHNGIEQIKQLGASLRLYYLSAVTTLITLISLSFITFGFRTNIDVKQAIPFTLFHLALLNKPKKAGYFRGIISDEQDKPLAGVHIDIMPHDGSAVLMHTTTDNLGRFQYKNSLQQEYIKLVLSKDSYPITERVEKNDSDAIVKITLKKKSDPSKRYSNAVMQEIFGSFFEVLLIMCLIAEIIFIQSFGLARTLPFIIISLFNLMLWLFYHRQTHV